MRTVGVATAVLWVALASPSLAQPAGQEAPARQPPAAAQEQPAATPPVAARQAASLIWTEDLEDRKIRNPNGDELGEIEGVLLDDAEGRVPYVMVEAGGFLGIGGRLVAVPWGALVPDPGGNGYTLNVTEDVLRAAPSVGENDFDEVADANWQQAVEAYWSQRAGLAPAKEPGAE